MKTLTVALDDLEGADHGGSLAGTYVVARVWYTHTVTLTDGTVVPPAPKVKALGSDGLAEFEVYASDDPLVIPEAQGFGVVVEATIQATTGDRSKRSWRKVVKPFESMVSPVSLGSLLPASPLPAGWVSVDDFVAGTTDTVQAAAADAESAAADAAAAEAAAQQAAADAATATEATFATVDSGTATLITDPNAGPLTQAALDGSYAARRLGLAAGKVTPAQAPYDAQHPVVVDAFGGSLWGYQGNMIHQSTDGGTSWTPYAAPPAGDVVLRLIPCADGEVISARVGGIYKSTGWASGSPTWTQKVAANGQAKIQQFQVDGDGVKFIAAQYGPGATGSQAWTDSRYAHVSVDGGDTWTLAFDSDVTLPGQVSHLHGACYDPWSDRFYLSEGHGDSGGVWVSSDDGATWTRPAGLVASPAPTVLVATDDGIVCASDANETGLWGIARQPDPEDESFVRTWAWVSGGADAVIGFGSRGYRDPETGVVYVGFTSGQTTVAPVIAGGTASAGGEVWRMPEPGTYTVGDSIHQVVVSGGVMHAARTFSGATDATLTATLPAPGAGTSLVDTGSIFGGSAGGSSVAVGPGSSVPHPAYSSVAVGYNARIEGGQGGMIAVGANALATGAGGCAIGTGSQAASSAFALGTGSLAAGESVAIGDSATTTTQTRGVAIGRNALSRVQCVSIGFGSTAATGTGAWAVAIGDSAQAGHQATAVGRSAQATVTDSTAIGHQASATNSRSVALGKGSTTTNVDQVAIGARQIEGGVLPGAPGNGAAGTYRLFATTDTNGKVRLQVKFPTGASITLATEA